MGYYTGTATNNADLWTKLRGHAELEGWTCSFASPYHTFESDNLKISLQENTASTGYVKLIMKFETTGAGAFNLGVHPEYSAPNVEARYSDPIISYHAFINTDGIHPTIYCAFEILPNIWRHVQFGIMKKHGSAEGGAFMFGCFTYRSYDYNYTNNGGLGFTVFSSGQSDEDGTFTWTDFYGNLVHALFRSGYGWTDGDTLTARYATTTGYHLTPTVNQPNSAYPYIYFPMNPDTGAPIINPTTCYASTPYGRWSAVGTMPNIALISMEGLADAQSVVIGSDTWRVFPLRASGLIIDTGLTEESNNFGYAYKI